MTEIHEVKEQLEILVQQTSAHHSDTLSKMSAMDSKMSSMENTINGMQQTINNWKFGGKLTIALFVAVGAVITWILNTLGIHLGLK